MVLPVGRIDAGIRNRVAAVNHHAVANIDANVRRADGIIGFFKEDQVTRLCICRRNVAALAAQSVCCRIQLCRVVKKRTLLCTGTQRTRRRKKNRDNVTGIYAEPELGQIYEFETRYGEILKRATDEYILPSKYYRDGLNKVLTVQTEPQAIRTIKTFSSVWLTASSPSNLV